jgi:zinc and cadmium transporter
LIAPIVPLTYYCLLIIAASVVGGMIPQWVRLTHRGMQIALSFVAAMMLGVGMWHMLPHALAEARLADAAGTSSATATGAAESADQSVLLWMVAGCITMFFIERFFCFHHHDVETDSTGHVHEHEESCHHHHGHDVTWSGAVLGLTLHSMLEGVALAASLGHEHGKVAIAGLGTFLVIFLHKPFDSMTIAVLMARGGWSPQWRSIVNGLFALAIPLGAALVFAGIASGAGPGQTVAKALAFSAGTFLCISLSDLLPELQFHDHDRVKLSVALLAGLALAFGIGRLETLAHRHPTPANGAATSSGATTSEAATDPAQSSR